MRPIDRLRVTEVFGLSPLSVRWREALLALRGDGETPPTKFGPSSLKMVRPSIALPLWLGLKSRGRRVPLYNLFNYLQPPPEEGWSVRVTRVRDFLGTNLTYDSHNGTDFAVPLGTLVVAPAPGVVGRVSSEFNRGGLKVFLDHGEGLVTSANHLARALVKAGDRVQRGQPIALSGYSGMDGVVTFPWGAPHVHFNVWLDGRYVDPFAEPGAVSLWKGGNWPVPHRGAVDDEAIPESDWDEAGVEAAIAACRHTATREALQSVKDARQRAMAALFYSQYYPSRFAGTVQLYQSEHARRGRLDLPFRADDFDGVLFPHGAEPER